MADRLTNYFGQVPLETDLLHTNQNAMVALAKLSAGVLGTSVIVNGFTCTPTGPASLNVILTAGEVYQLANLEATAWSSLPADTAHSILKQGILLDPLTFAITPPGTVGFSQVYLIEVQYADSDAGSTVLPYFNAANPSSPFNGPGNAGTAQNTVRKGIVATQVKAGVAAATGTQVAPTADAGWTGLFTVTVANGQSTITTGNISQLASAPFINTPLPGIPAAVQAGQWLWAGTFGGTANALTATLTPAIVAYTAGMRIQGKAAATNTSSAVTVSVNGLPAKSVVHQDGSALYYGDLAAGRLIDLEFDGTNLVLMDQTAPIAPLNRVLFPTSTTYNATQADQGSWCYQNGSNATTYNLPLCSAFGVGYIGFLNNLGQGITVNCAGGGPGGTNQFQFAANPALTTITLSATKSWLILLCDGSNWTIFSADPNLNASLPQSQSAGAVGWKKLDGGLIYQWGTSVVTTNASGDASIAFPTAFPNAVYSVVACNGDVTSNYIISPYTGVSLTTAGFAINAKTANTAAVVNTGSVRVNWVAFGK